MTASSVDGIVQQLQTPRAGAAADAVPSTLPTGLVRADLDGEELLTTMEAAVALRVTEGYLAKMRVSGDGPVYVRVGPRLIRYRASDLRAYVEARRERSTSEAHHSQPTTTPHRPSTRACLRKSSPAVASVAAGADAGEGVA